MGTDLGAYEFRFPVTRRGMSLVEAEIHIRTCSEPGHEDRRVETMLAFAATQKLSPDAYAPATPIQQVEIDRLKLSAVVGKGAYSEARELAKELLPRILALTPPVQAALDELHQSDPDPHAEMKIVNYSIYHNSNVLIEAMRMVIAILGPIEAATA